MCGRFLQADARTRTADPFITSEVLYQLSYVGEAPKCTAAAAREHGHLPCPRAWCRGPASAAGAGRERRADEGSASPRRDVDSISTLR